MQVHVTIHLELDEEAAKQPLIALLDIVENKAADAYNFMEGVTQTQLLVAPIKEPE
jgi:hypothetical protein